MVDLDKTLYLIGAYVHFLYVARGSIAEVEYLLHLSRRIGYLQDDEYKKTEDLRTETSKTLQGLINSVKEEANKTKDLS